MRNVIYLDIIVLLDILINFIFLIFIERIYNEKKSLIKIIVASITGGLLIIPVFYYKYYLKIFKILGGLIIVLLLSFTNEKSKVIIKISLFYTINFSFVGLLTTFKITKWYILIASIVVILIIVFLENYRKYHIFIRDCEYNVIIYSNNKLYKIKGLLDTGNISSFLGYPIIYINEKYNLKFDSLDKVNINIETVNGINCTKGYIYKNFLFEVNNKKYFRDVIIVLSNISVDCLLNPMLML